MVGCRSSRSGWTAGLLLLLPLGAAAGCVHLPAGTIRESTSSLGDLVWVNRQVPVFALGMPGCFVQVASAHAGEFRWGGEPYVLVDLGLHNGAPHALQAVELEVLAYDLAGQLVSREVGEIAVSPQPLMTGQAGEARWANRLPAPDSAVRVSARLVRARAANGMACGVAPGPGTSPPPAATLAPGAAQAPPPPSRAPLVAPAPPPSPPGPQTAPPASTEDPVLRFGQYRLNQQGYACGEPSGLLDEQTRACIRAFQHDEGLPPTGELDAATWARLDALGTESEDLAPGEGWREE